jgi:molybdate transport system permease protein
MVETLIALPLVLPPVITGLILLRLFGRRSPLGGWLDQTFHTDVVFTWKAVILALSVMSLPLLVRNSRTAIEAVSPELEQMARTLGAPEWRVFLFITLPLAKRGILAGCLLAFARALGEFGATIMVAGNIPGKTTTLSVAIYQNVQLGREDTVWKLAAISGGIAFVVLFVSERLLKKKR